MYFKLIKKRKREKRGGGEPDLSGSIRQHIYGFVELGRFLGINLATSRFSNCMILGQSVDKTAYRALPYRLLCAFISASSIIRYLAIPWSLPKQAKHSSGTLEGTRISSFLKGFYLFYALQKNSSSNVLYSMRTYWNMTRLNC